MSMFNDDQKLSIGKLFEQLATETYSLPRKNLQATTFVPAQSGVNPWSGSFVWKEANEIGIAKFISDYAEDLPPVSRALNLRSMPIREIGCAYSYSDAELNMYLTAGIALSRDEAETARRKIDEKVDEVILKGEESLGLTGLLNNANVTKVAIDAGAAGGTQWTGKTLAEIIKDVQAMIDSVRTISGNTEKADSLLLPHSAFVYVSSTPKDTNGGDLTILGYLKNVFAAQGIRNIDECDGLEGLGGDGIDRAVLYTRDASCVSYALPIPFRQKDPQECALHYKVPCFARIGGTVIKRLKSIVYADGI